MSRDGVLDVLMTVDALTDTGDWTDVPLGALRYAVRLLDGASRATGLDPESIARSAPREEWIAQLRRLRDRLAAVIAAMPT